MENMNRKEKVSYLMEKKGIIFSLYLAFFILLIATIIPSTGANNNISRKIRRPLKEKYSNIKVYWHDIVSGSKQSSFCIIPAVNSSSVISRGSSFGAVNMIDNPLTSGPDLGSKLVGRAQGMYAGASEKELAFLMAMNFVFSTGKYNQSSLTLVGRNSVFQHTRELSVVGGSGLFRFVRGFAVLKTVHIDATVATVLYDLHLLHY